VSVVLQADDSYVKIRIFDHLTIYIKNMEKCLTKVINLRGGLVNRTCTLWIASTLCIMPCCHITYLPLPIRRQFSYITSLKYALLDQLSLSELKYVGADSPHFYVVTLI